MKKALTILALVLVPATAGATPINYATLVSLGGPGVDIFAASFVGPSGQQSASNAQVSLSGSANIATGQLKALNVGTGAQGAAAQAMFFDTITFGHGAFQGAFGTSYNLTVNANFTGTFSSSGALDSGGTGGRIWVYDGSTVVDSSVFLDNNHLLDFFYFNPPATPLCTDGNGVNFPGPQGAFSFSASCTVTVNATNPSLKIFMNLPAIMNGLGGTWSIDLTHTGTLTADFGGRPVTSASGAFPGTAAEVPEPATLVLVGLGLVAAAARIRPRESIPGIHSRSRLETKTRSA